MRGLTLTRNLENVAAVAAWLEAKGHSRLCLIGSSMGGGTGLWFSALHPEWVVAGLHIAPALDLEGSLLAWAGPERTRAWQETGTIRFESELVSCELGWELIEDLRAYRSEDLLAAVPHAGPAAAGPASTPRCRGATWPTSSPAAPSAGSSCTSSPTATTGSPTARSASGS